MCKGGTKKRGTEGPSLKLYRHVQDTVGGAIRALSVQCGKVQGKTSTKESIQHCSENKEDGADGQNCI